MSFKSVVLFSLIFVFGLGIGIVLTIINSGVVPREAANESQSNKMEFSGEDEKIRLLLLGDMMFDRQIRVYAQNNDYGYIFQGVEDLLQSADLAVGNLEGPITNNDSVSIGSEIGSKENYIFTFHPEVSTALYLNKIRLVNLGNNHTLNFGEQGFLDTLSFLDKNQINYFGNVGSGLLEYSYKIIEIRKLKIGFVNYNQFINDSLKLALEDLDAIRKNVDILIIYAHWGNEYAKVANNDIQGLAHVFIENGADIVVGSHPHVIQQSENYKDRMIYYSLGNFIFDQYFSEETKNGLVLEVEIDPNDLILNINEHIVYTNTDGRTVLGDN